jgi:hypothetical protein
MRSVRLGVILTILTMAPCVAFAQGASSQAEAQALFDAGRKLMDQGRFGEACPKLEASQKLDPGAGTLMNLASCYEKNGQTASAWVTYTDAATASSSSGHADWAAKANAKAAGLQPHLAKVTLTMPSPPEGVTIKRDGKPVAYASLGTELPMDPGDHTLEVSAPGKTTWTSQFRVRAESPMSVTIPDLANAATTGGGGTTAPSDTGRGNGQRILGLTLAGLGAVSIGIGSGLGIDAASKKGVADDPSKCLHTADGKLHCNKDGVDQLDAANASATISTVLFVVGGALIAGGIVLFIASPKAAAAAETKTGVRIAPTLGGLLVSGTF